MLTLRTIRSVRFCLRQPMTYGEIERTAGVTGLELFVVRYSPRLNKGGGSRSRRRDRRIMARMQHAISLPTATEALRRMRAWGWSCK